PQTLRVLVLPIQPPKSPAAMIARTVVHNAIPSLKQHIYFSQTLHPQLKNKRAFFSTALLEILKIIYKFVKK
ncbi:hypothetical protein, partial [Altibacter sp. HG106]|uniref:hypothetical protein n=1 Tax=Altibacter sp. HG106 TaxID=3023937 RepID=UPI0023502681